MSVPIAVPRTDTAAVIRAALCVGGPGHGQPIAFGPVTNESGHIDWVCLYCGQPTIQKEVNTVGTIMFRGGPLNGQAFNTKDLLHNHNPELTRNVAEYKWTKETVRSQRTSAVARVWVHRDLAEAESSVESAQPRKERAVMTEATTEAPAFPGPGEAPIETVSSPDPTAITPTPEPPAEEHTSYGSEGVTGDPSEISAMNAENVGTETDVESAASAAAATSPEQAGASETEEKPKSRKVKSDEPKDPRDEFYTDLDDQGRPLVTKLDGTKIAIRDYRNELKVKAGTFNAAMAERAGRPKWTGMNQYHLEVNGGSRVKANVGDVQTAQAYLNEVEREQQSKAAQVHEALQEPAGEAESTPQEQADVATPLA